MKKLLAVLALAGCSSGGKFVEGTSFQLGAYVPWESNLYGVELVSYVNGCVFKAQSNAAFRVRREFAATNSYLWGMAETRESTRTEVETSGSRAN